jgi:periplasmic protein TonB
LLETIDPDTARKEKEIKYDDERQGGFDGGQKAWVKFLIKTINPDVVMKSVSGGVVYVRFLITKNGDVEDIHLRKSVEFILDEEALRVLYKSPKWIPAFQNGHTVNAYRVQPFTFDPAEE